jgi:hypothetical protein
MCVLPPLEKALEIGAVAVELVLLELLDGVVLIGTSW